MLFVKYFDEDSILSILYCDSFEIIGNMLFIHRKNSESIIPVKFMKIVEVVAIEKRNYTK